jgi:Domain of unknown function (DUF4386)
MAAVEIRRASTIAGIALLLVAVLGGFAYVGVLERLVVEDDAAETAANLAGSETLFRLAVASLLIVAALDVVVALALYRVFQPASRDLSLLAAWLRVAYAAIFVAAIAQLGGVLRLVPEAGEASGQVLSGVHAYEDVWSAGLLIFGGHLLVLGALVVRTAYSPTVLGVLLVIAGLGYAVDSFGELLFAGYDVSVAAFTFVGEVVLIFWLLLRGRRITLPSQ